MGFPWTTVGSPTPWESSGFTWTLVRDDSSQTDDTLIAVLADCRALPMLTDVPLTLMGRPMECRGFLWTRQDATGLL